MAKYKSDVGDDRWFLTLWFCGAVCGCAAWLALLYFYFARPGVCLYAAGAMTVALAQLANSVCNSWCDYFRARRARGEE